MLTRLGIGAVALTLSCTAVMEAQAKRDPFMQSGGGAASTVKAGKVGSESLTSSPIMAYKLIGLVASEKKSIAIIQTRDHKNHLVKIGDKLGREGGFVKDITIDGITVKMGEETVGMTVSNIAGGQKNEKK